MHWGKIFKLKIPLGIRGNPWFTSEYYETLRVEFILVLHNISQLIWNNFLSRYESGMILTSPISEKYSMKKNITGQFQSWIVVKNPKQNINKYAPTKHKRIRNYGHVELI